MTPTSIDTDDNVDNVQNIDIHNSFLALSYKLQNSTKIFYYQEFMCAVDKEISQIYSEHA